MPPVVKRRVQQDTSTGVFVGVLRDDLSWDERLFYQIESSLYETPFYVSRVSIGVTDKTWLEEVSAVVEASAPPSSPGETLRVFWEVLLGCLLLALNLSIY